MGGNSIERDIIMKMNMETLFDWKQNPAARDALCGTMWLDKWRGTLDEYLSQSDNSNVFKRTAKRLSSTLKSNKMKSKISTIKAVQMALGTYGWGRDTPVIIKALENGLAIDSAWTYGRGKVETELSSITDGGVLITKLPRPYKSYQAVINRGKKIKTMFPNWTRILQIHWPTNNMLATMSGMAKVCREKLAHELGACNCSWDIILTMKHIAPISHLQIRFNPMDCKSAEWLIPHAKKRDMIIWGYSPFANDISQIKLADKNKCLPCIAKHHDATIFQVLIAFQRFHGVRPIFQTNNISHLNDNVDALDLELDEDEIQTIKESFNNELL
jgi:diketogulonate reductase-like aldo/keto reductase